MNLNYLFSVVTDIGDSASLLAITIAGSLYLLFRGAGRAALFLMLAFLFSALCVSVMKLAFLGCQHYFNLPSLRSPSGHAALSAAAFWGYCILMRSHLDSSRRFLPLLLLTLLIALIAMSRIWLHDHTPTEVWVGLLTGTICLFIVYFLILRGKAIPPFDAYALALWGVGAAFLAHGWHFPAEDLIHLLAFHLKGHVAICS